MYIVSEFCMILKLMQKKYEVLPIISHMQIILYSDFLRL